MPIFNVIAAAEMCSLPKKYPQLRREHYPKSTPPTHSAHPSGGAKCWPAYHHSVSMPIFSVIAPAEMCSLTKEYLQLRRELFPKSTPPTHSAHPLWNIQMLASVTPERLHAHHPCHPEGSDVLPT